MPAKLKTVGDVARDLGIPRYRVQYVLLGHPVEPVQWIGNVRCYDERGVKEIKVALGEVKRRGPVPAA